MTESPAALDELVARVEATTGTELARLAEAVVIAEQLLAEQVPAEQVPAEQRTEVADELIDHFVVEARRAGHSWAEIGVLIAGAKQAATKQTGGTKKRPSPLGGFSDRITPEVRSAMVRSTQEARATGHADVGPDHLVLALLADPEGPAAGAIAAQGVSLDAVRTAARAGMSAPDGPAAPDHIPFAKPTARVFQLALREALRVENDDIGTGHLFLGVLAEPDSRGARALTAAGVAVPDAEASVLAALADARHQTPAG